MLIETELDRERLKGAAEQAAALPAAELNDEPDPNDTTSILHGAASALGKAAWSAMRVAQVSNPIAQYEAARLQHEREAEEARELAHLMEWNAQMISVGGVRMTNAEAQDARRHVRDNADAFADRAIQNGDLREDERENFKRWTRRKIELEERRGRGILSPEEQEELRRGDASRAGRFMDKATAETHQSQAVDLAVTAGNANRAAPQRPLEDYALFQATTAPGMRNNDSQAAAPAPVSAAAKATGLNL